MCEGSLRATAAESDAPPGVRMYEGRNKHEGGQTAKKRRGQMCQGQDFGGSHTPGLKKIHLKV